MMRVKIFKLWLPVIVWAGMIFYFSGRPRMDSGLEQFQSGLELDCVLRKSVHVFEYFILACLMFRAIKGSFALNQYSLFFHTIILSVLYAFSDEFHQIFVPTRTGSIYDVMVDCIGVLIAYVVLRFWENSDRHY